MNVLDRLALALRVLVEPEPRPAPPPEPAFDRIANPLREEDGAAARQDAALGLMDDECYGFVLLTVRRHAGSAHGEVCLQQHVDARWWPALGLTMERMAREVRALR